MSFYLVSFLSQLMNISINILVTIQDKNNATATRSLSASFTIVVNATDDNC